MEKVSVIKIGGNVIDDEERLHSFLQLLAKTPGKKVLIHGGGKLATALAEQMGVPQKMIEGRRITDVSTIKIVTMMYAGYINKNIVARLQALGCNALGLTGADANCITAQKRPLINGIDYGFVGDVQPNQDGSIWSNFIDLNLLPVIAPLTHDGKGQLLNTNADTIAQEIACMLSQYYSVELMYLFEKNGVLMDVSDERSVIPDINLKLFAELKEQNVIAAGMIPKLDNAFEAIKRGVSTVRIGRAEDLQEVRIGKSGTRIK